MRFPFKWQRKKAIQLPSNLLYLILLRKVVETRRELLLQGGTQKFAIIENVPVL